MKNHAVLLNRTISNATRLHHYSDNLLRMHACTPALPKKSKIRNRIQDLVNIALRKHMLRNNVPGDAPQYERPELIAKI